jgi:hypothetical protein
MASHLRYAPQTWVPKVGVDVQIDDRARRQHAVLQPESAEEVD